MSHSSSGRKASAALGWFPMAPVTEAAIIDMASARQVALRHRLRLHYWQTECRPLTETTINLTRRKMMFADPQDELSPESLTELLSLHYGFEPIPGTSDWRIPELEEAYRHAVGAVQRRQEQAVKAGKASAEKRAQGGSGAAAQGPTPGGPPGPRVDPDDF